VNTPAPRTRRRLQPPSGFEGYLCRQDAAAALGLPSEFKIRQLEKEGRLRPVRGRMGSAWYRREEVLALRPLLAGPAGVTGGARRGRAATDAEVLAALRTGPKTVVDLVVETGISVARAQRLYRFWLSHDRHPRALAVQGEAPVGEPPAPAPPAMASAPSERRSPERRARAALIRQLRDPDPRVRDTAFAALKPRRGA
jgi:hypothetical protein